MTTWVNGDTITPAFMNLAQGVYDSGTYVAAGVSLNGTLSVAGNSTLNGSLTVALPSMFDAITASSVGATSGVITSSLTVGTTLGVTGTSTMAAINASGTVAAAGALTVGTTLGVTGTATMAAINASGTVAASGAVTIGTTLTTTGFTKMNGGYSGGTPPAINTNASYTQLSTDSVIITNVAGTTTITLLNPATYPGRVLWIKTIQAQTVVSASANVKPPTTDVAGTAIIAGTDGGWAMLVSDGTNWVNMANSAISG